MLFFVLESVLFRRPFAWRTFGIGNQQDAETTRDWALNQGFYNLFLAVGVVVGVLLQLSERCRHGRPRASAWCCWAPHRWSARRWCCW